VCVCVCIYIYVYIYIYICIYIYIAGSYPPAYPRPPHTAGAPLKACGIDANLAAQLGAQLAELQRLVSSSADQFQTLRADTDSNFANVFARLSLLEGRMKMVEATVLPPAADDHGISLGGISAGAGPHSGICACAGPPTGIPLGAGPHSGIMPPTGGQLSGSVQNHYARVESAAAARFAVSGLREQFDECKHAAHATAATMAHTFKGNALERGSSGGGYGSTGGEGGEDALGFVASSEASSGWGGSDASPGKIVATRVRPTPSEPLSTADFIAQMQRRLDEAQTMLRDSATGAIAY